MKRPRAEAPIGRMPEGMTREHGVRLATLPDEARGRVIERAAIIQEATGCTWPEADEQALLSEGIEKQRSLFGGGS